jgi:sugar lactone lactonase YvrE
MNSSLALSPSESLCYLTETMTTYVTKYFLAGAEDSEVIKMLEPALRISQEGVKMASDFFH